MAELIVNDAIFCLIFCAQKPPAITICHRLLTSGGSRPGPGGPRPPHFLSSLPQFFHRLLIIAPHSALGGPPPQTVLARTATASLVAVKKTADNKKASLRKLRV